MIIISGPVVVSPGETITFQAYLSDKKFSDGKWFKLKNSYITQIEVDHKKYCTLHNFEKLNVHQLDITNAEEDDSATYQFSINDIRSNTITTCVDGKYYKLSFL